MNKQSLLLAVNTGLLAIVVFFLIRHIVQFDEVKKDIDLLTRIVATSAQVDLLEGAMMQLHGDSPDAFQTFRDLRRSLSKAKNEQLLSAISGGSVISSGSTMSYGPGVGQEWARLIEGDAIIEASWSHAHIGAIALNLKSASTHAVVAPFDAIVARVDTVTRF